MAAQNTNISTSQLRSLSVVTARYTLTFQPSVMYTKVQKTAETVRHSFGQDPRIQMDVFLLELC